MKSFTSTHMGCRLGCQVGSGHREPSRFDSLKFPPTDLQVFLNKSRRNTVGLARLGREQPCKERIFNVENVSRAGTIMSRCKEVPIMWDRINGTRTVLVVCAVALLAIVGNTTFRAATAKAQSGAKQVQVFQSAGPISLSNGESALIGLLLPAVQRKNVLPYRLQLFDGSGTVIADVKIPVGGRKVVMFDVFFGDGSVRVVDKASGEVVTSGKSDGILIGLLLPAVEPNGDTIGAMSASIQLYNGDGNRGQVVQMGDASV